MSVQDNTYLNLLVDPIHVLEGSINFNVLDTPDLATGSHYGITWWGVQKVPEE
ncbi:unnamed protein product [marine sediment metagenome]|uniref:Uncharacterized protein n=1 Tax=marine sediment metagenome TaxID=412755 RepID=X1IGA8_9ZZZZ